MEDFFEMQRRRWAEIKDRVFEYYDQLDDLANYCDFIEKSRQDLSHVDWSKVSPEKKEEVLSEVNEVVNIAKEQISEKEAQFHLLCDFMEEALFSFINFSKQEHRYDEEECQRIVRDTLDDYKRFAITVKERFGFERSDEQKAKRTKQLKELLS